MTVEDRDNLRFRIGDLLIYTHRRFHELFPEEAGEKYTEEYVRGNLLRHIMPVLERYRFVKRITPPSDMRLDRDTDTIYEALPALYHYNAGRLSRSIGHEQERTNHDTPATVSRNAEHAEDHSRQDEEKHDPATA